MSKNRVEYNSKFLWKFSVVFLVEYGRGDERKECRSLRLTKRTKRKGIRPRRVWSEKDYGEGDSGGVRGVGSVACGAVGN